MEGVVEVGEGLGEKEAAVLRCGYAGSDPYPTRAPRAPKSQPGPLLGLLQSDGHLRPHKEAGTPGGAAWELT